MKETTKQSGAGQGLLCLAAGFWCSTALCMNILVPDQAQALEDYAVQLSMHDSTVMPAEVPALLTNLAKLRQYLPWNSLTWTVCAAALAYAFYRVWAAGPRRPAPGPALLGGLFGVIQVFGLSICRLGSWDFVLASRFQLLVALFCMVGYGVVYYTVALALQQLLAGGLLASGPNVPPAGPLARRWDKHPQAAATLLILAGWAPWVLACLPGSVPWDGAAQLLQALGLREMNTHSPYFSTMLHGALVLLGRLFGSDNLGIFLYILLQSVFSAWVYGSIVGLAARLGCRRGLQWGITAFFALVPMWGAFAQAFIKDTLFTALFALFIRMTAELLLAEKSAPLPPRQLAGYGAAAFFTCLMRHNGCYAVLPCLFLVGALRMRGQARRGVLCCAAGVAVAFFGFNAFVQYGLGIPKGSVVEALSIPLQQTARYVLNYGDEVTPEEQTAIDAVLEYGELARVYNPNLSDPVKMTYREPDRATLARYFQVWLQMGLKRPLCYLQATHANSYGYYTVIDSGVWRNKEQYFMYTTSNWLESLGVQVHYLGAPTARYALYNWALNFAQLPLFGILCSCGAATWLGAALLAALGKGRRTAWWLAVPMGLLLLTCIASPANDMLRYCLPLFAALPVLLCMAVHANRPGFDSPVPEVV